MLTDGDGEWMAQERASKSKVVCNLTRRGENAADGGKPNNLSADTAP